MRAVYGILCAVVASTLLSAAGDETGFFATYAPVNVSLKAPFEELFANAQKNADYTVDATVAYAGPNRDQHALEAELSVRGRTSKRESECSFPKLKLRFKDGDALRSSIFRGIKTIKIGTHCGDQPDGELTERFGRWANEKAPLREAFVYRLLEILQVRSFKARPGRITYLFADEDRRVTRNAMFLEDDREAMKRFGATREIEPPQFRNAERDFTPDDSARLAFAEALTGNFDWCLKFSADDTYRCDARRPLWNILAFAKTEGTAMPVLYDFDIAGMVVGHHQWTSRIYYEGFLESKSAPAIEVLGQLQHTRSVFSKPVLDRTRRAFLDKKDDAFRALDDADLDSYGRSTIRSYMTAFFDIVGRDDRFYAPVIVRDGERIYLDAQKTKPACPRDNVAPIGTLVGPAIETNGDMMKAAILDVQWKWAAQGRCDAVHRGPVWVDRTAVGTNYPVR